MAEIKCGICNYDLMNTGLIRDSNENEGIDSDCSCWFCMQCLQWMHKFKVSECRRCGNDIYELVKISCPRTEMTDHRGQCGCELNRIVNHQPVHLEADFVESIIETEIKDEEINFSTS